MPDHLATEPDLRRRLRDLKALAAEDPMVNPIRRLGMELDRALDAGESDLAGLEALIQDLTVEAFAGRARRLKAYLVDTDPRANDARLRALFERLAGPPDAPAPFEAFRAKLERAGFGIVFTAHPTFGLKRALRQILSRLAAGVGPEGRPLEPEQEAALLERAKAEPHGPDERIDLAREHAQAEEAIAAAQGALDRAIDIALDVARERYPDDWTALTPRPVTLASWVGYDLDGRTDIGWADTLEKRMAVRAAQLRRYIADVQALISRARAEDEADGVGQTLALLESKLALSVKIAEEEAAAFRIDGSDRDAVRALGKTLADNDSLRLTDMGEIAALIGTAIEAARDPALIKRLVRLRASVANLGLATAHTHVRLNATQVHNAVRRLTGLTGEPDEAARRRGYLARLSALLAEVEPARINLGSLMGERTTARRLMMAISVMLTHADATQPIRFLIAECDTPFTVLAALYLARQFDVAERIDISPLFETPEALERGSTVIEALLDNPHYVDYVRTRGRLAIQTGFSDAGRFLGQAAAAMAVERLHMKLARLLAERGLEELEVVIFDTHGESIGRGAHPGGMAERLAYLASPAARELYEELGLTVKHEVSFQGGDGYTLFGTPELAYAVVARILEHSLGDTRAAPDPFYTDTDNALEFFLAVAGFNRRIMQDRDYGALIGAFGTNLLYPTGSRKAKRQHETAHGIDRNHPSQMRAIPHNAVLHQMGWLANSLGGLGEAIARDRDWFAAALPKSDRLGRIMRLASHARDLGRLTALDAYCETFDPSYWLKRAMAQRERHRTDELRRVALMLENDETHARMRRIVRMLTQDAIDLKDGLALAAKEAGIAFDPALEPELAEALELLHAIRLALILRVFEMAMRVPPISLRHDVTLEEMVARLFELDVEGAVRILKEAFPADPEPLDLEDFGEPATYRGESDRDYREEHRLLFEPLSDIYDLIRRISVAISHLVGAHG